MRSWRSFSAINRTSGTLLSGSVTRIIRFVGDDNKVHFGEEPERGQPATVLEGDLFSGLKRTSTQRSIRTLLSPLVPVDIFCVGLNYMKHWEESAKLRKIPLPEKPVIFMKPSSALNHPNADIWIPSIVHGDQLDWEVELAIVIGKECRNVKKEQALDYVLGFTIGNDVSSRHWQKNAGADQWIKGKGFDTFAPLGPVLVTTQAIPNPQTLRIQTRVNGATQQDSNTADMIFSCGQIIEWLSTDMTLRPGTVILTGTPSGVAAGRSPPNWLKAGDVVECEIENIGLLKNKITNPPSRL